MDEERKQDFGAWQDLLIRWIHSGSMARAVKGLRAVRPTRWLIYFRVRRTRHGRWVARRAAKLRFFARRSAYIREERLFGATIASQSVFSIARFAVTPVVFAVLAVVVCTASPVAYDNLAARFGWPPLALPIIDDATYTAIMATVAQAAAAVLALFFAAVSVVASTAYAKITASVRSLVAQDDLNRCYLRLLAHTAATALVGIGLYACGIAPSVLLVGYVLAMSVVCLLAFLPLGIRTFALFDSAALSGYPLRSFSRALRNATNEGRRWLAPSFQDHSRRIAESQLSLLEDLLLFAIHDDRPRNDTVVGLIKAVHHLTRFYSARKSRIPSESLWFPRAAQFRRWQLASSSMTGIALHAGVSPLPESVPDCGFVESRCIEMTARCFRHLSNNASTDDLVILLMEVNYTATAHARLLEQGEATRLVENIQPLVVEYLKGIDRSSEPLKHLQMVDVLCVAALAPVLNTSLSLTEASSHSLVAVEGPLLSLSLRQSYEEVRSRSVIRGIEDLVQRLQFERTVEGVVQTQPWYVHEVLARLHAESIRDTIAGIVKAVEQHFIRPATELAGAERELWAGAWFQRGIEACSKAREQIKALDALHSDLEGYQKTEAQWFTSGAVEALAAIEIHRSTIIRSLAKLVPALSAISTDSSIPDLLGETRARLAEEMVAMMERRQEEGFADLFSAYFNASLSVRGQFVELAEEPGKADYIRAAMDVMVDVMDISGLALIFGELDNTSFGRVVCCAWELFFKNSQDQKAAVNAFLLAIDSSLGLPIFSPSAMQRQAWGQRLAKALVDRGVQVDRDYAPWSRDQYKPHPNPIIESLNVHLGHPTNKPHEYFAALYLAELDNAKDLKIPRRVRDRMNAIERAAARQQEARDANQPNET